MSKPSSAQSIAFLVVAGGFGLLVLAAALAMFALSNTARATLNEVDVRRELYREDAQRNDALRARLLARSGLARALAELRPDAPPPPELRGSLGATYSNGLDLYEVSVEAKGDGLELTSRGQVAVLDYSRRLEVRGAHEVRATLRRQGERWIVASESEQALPAEAPR